MKTSRAKFAIGLIITALLLSMASIPTAQATSYSVGDTGPAGGKIFITPSTSGNTTGLYFEAAPLDVSNSRYLWCNGSNQTIPGANGTAIGSGKTNTQAMLNHGCTSGAGYIASQYSAGGFTDWFLPSSGEVIEAQKLYGHGLFTGTGLDGQDIHWTSTWVSSSTSYIWYPYITGASLTTSYSLAGGGFFVRAVRSFSPTKSQSEIDAENEAARKENERKRQEAVRAAQEEMVRKVKARIEVLKSDLAAAELALIGQPLLERANTDFKNLDTATAINYPLVNYIISKYEVYDRISGNISGTIYPRDLVKYGLLEESTPMKSLILRDIKSRFASERDTFEEINQLLAKAKMQQLARKERLASTIARIHAR